MAAGTLLNVTLYIRVHCLS